MADAAQANAVLAAREGWNVNPAHYDSPADPRLVEHIAQMQEESRTGWIDGFKLSDLGLKPLVVDGRLGPKTKRFLMVLADHASAVEAGMVGAPTWGQWAAEAFSFTTPLREVEPERGGGGVDIRDVGNDDDFDFDFDDDGIVIDVPDPRPGGGGGMGKWIGLGLLAAAVALA